MIDKLKVRKGIEQPHDPTVERVFTFGSLVAGDCGQFKGTMHFYPDGTGLYECTSYTDSTNRGDIWHSHFDLENAGGGILFTCETADSPTMWPDKFYQWGWTFSYPSSIYTQIAQIVQRYSC